MADGLWQVGLWQQGRAAPYCIVTQHAPTWPGNIWTPLCVSRISLESGSCPTTLDRRDVCTLDRREICRSIISHTGRKHAEFGVRLFPNDMEKQQLKLMDTWPHMSASPNVASSKNRP